MTSHQVIVIGAGLSGLSAASLLDEHGIDVLVLEASKRVGGRMMTVKNAASGYVDLGAAYISHSQRRLLALMAKYGIRTCSVYSEGDALCYRNGRVLRYSSNSNTAYNLGDKLDANYVARSLSDLCSKIKIEEPWSAPSAQELDKISYQDWLDKTITSKSVKANITMLSRANFCADPHEVSLLWALWDMKTAGGMVEMNSCGDGTQEMKFDGGAQQLPEALFNDLKDKVLLEEPVHRIVSSGDRVTIFTDKGNQFQANRIIVAIPPNAQARITVEPPPSATRSQLVQRVPMGSIIKSFVYYDRPYWREKGLSGLLTVEDDNFPVITCMDDTKPDGSHPCLIGFIASAKARELSSLSRDERRKLVAAQYAAMFECPEMNNPVHYEDHDWSTDIWVGGGYSGIMAPGVVTQFGWTLRKPEGLIHFAGTETASVWPGYMEGAIESGHRAAREVLAIFGKEPQALPYLDSGEDLNSDAQPTFLQRIMPSAAGLKTAVKSIGFLTAATVVGKYVMAKL